MNHKGTLWVNCLTIIKFTWLHILSHAVESLHQWPHSFTLPSICARECSPSLALGLAMCFALLKSRCANVIQEVLKAFEFSCLLCVCFFLILLVCLG